MSPLAARLLVKRSTLDILEAVTASDRTVKQIAAATGIDPSRTWRAVQQLCSAGLLTVARRQKRAGRPLKFYRASDHEFVIPASMRHSTVGSALSDSVQHQLEHRDQAIGERFYFDGSRWRVEKLYAADSAGADRQEERWLIARLSAEQRDSLAREIAAIFERYGREQQLTGGRSIIHFACVSEPSSGKLS